ncbi:MAG: SUMF1/EgtB/PvdO family nonheme iron enzyme, partial [Deltaproteobacteria bacterium]|nr:SUMF1/EgtB/PvdO family nonheme iron enzyme [Deltaproteobacteria bacterium]
MADPPRSVRVFISYSHDTDEYCDRVAALADRLRAEGVDAWIDQYEPHPAQGWRQWMQEQIEQADYVLLVCTSTYCRRFEGKDDVPDRGKGVTWEARIVQQFLYDARGHNDKAIAVLFDDGNEQDIPLVLRDYAHHRVFRDYDGLYFRLTQQEIPLPPLGPLRRRGTGRPRPPLGQDIVPSEDEADSLPPMGRAQHSDDFEDYIRHARAEHRDIPLLGFKERVAVAIGLEDLHVPVDVVLDHGPRGRVVHNNAHLAQQHEAPGLDCRRTSLAQAFGVARKVGRRGLVLLGDPGSGKTTQLKRMLLQMTSEEEGAGPAALGLPADTLPVFLPLRKLKQARTAGSSIRDDLDLPEFMQRVITGPVPWAPDDLALRLLKHRRLLLLVDGLDEVADETERRIVSRWIGDVLRHSPDSHVLVSCRYAGYTEDVQLDNQFLEVHLRPLDDEQVTAFVENWYRVVEAREAELREETAALGSAEALLQELRSSDFRGEAQLYTLGTNPLLLTALCLVHRRQGHLPRGRAALYHECTTVLLESWRERQVPGIHVLSAEHSRQVLQPVALWLHGEDERTQASADELRGSVCKGFAAIGASTEDPDAFLQRIRDESGLLTGWGPDRYGFMHLGLQEYLAALELARGLGAAEALARVAEQFGQTWWQEVILLMLARSDEAAFQRFMGLVVKRPEFPTWARSAMMQRVLADPKPAMAKPFAALLRAKGKRLAASQRAAAELLGRRIPSALDELATVFDGHPADGVRAWWRRWQALEGRGIESFVAPRGGVELVRIPGGKFLMGSPEGDELANNDEQPQDEVTLDSFYLARTPVTNAQYGEYLKANPDARQPAYWGNVEYNPPEQPVVGVSWDEAMAYCE